MVKEKSLSVRKEQGNRGIQCMCNSDGRGRDEASRPADVSFWGLNTPYNQGKSVMRNALTVEITWETKEVAHQRHGN